jgi:hypothetical protein
MRGTWPAAMQFLALLGGLAAKLIIVDERATLL